MANMDPGSMVGRIGDHKTLLHTKNIGVGFMVSEKIFFHYTVYKNS